jgi:hypothetical protein
MFVVPAPTAVTMPSLSTVATCGALLLHAVTAVPCASGSVVIDPSVYLPIAVNCNVLPVTRVAALPGVLNDALTRVGAALFSTGAAVIVIPHGEAVRLPTLAHMFVVPDSAAVTIPPLLIDPT